MSRTLLPLMCLLAAGCAATPQKPVAVVPSHQYTEVAAAALAFEPPIAEGEPHPELARGPRAPSAFLGFQEPTVEYYTSATDNLQSNEWGDFYTQESVSVKSGVRYR